MSETSATEASPLAVDPPARIVILGAGPIGLEAGLYARYLGYEVSILERGEVAAHVGQWGHVQLASPFSMTSSSLGLAALIAQDPQYHPPARSQLLTGAQWREHYLIPLAQTDLLADCIRTNTQVLDVKKIETTEVTTDEPDESPPHRFSVRVRNQQGQEEEIPAAVVIDASGVFGNSVGCGPRGSLVDGEQDTARHIEYRLPDVLGRDRELYESKRILVLGDTIWATMTLMGLSKLIEQAPTTRVTWLTAESLDSDDAPSLEQATQDPRHGRRQMAQIASRLVCGATPNMEYRSDATISALKYDEGANQFLVTTNSQAEPERFDRVISNAGFHRDESMYGPLTPDYRIPQDFADDTPPSEVDLGQACKAEPHFYVLGAKSLGRNSQFLVAIGLDQIRDLFALIGGRSDLDLYATANPNPK
jgi:hypothetical protein